MSRTAKERIVAVAEEAGVPCQPIAILALEEIERLEQRILHPENGGYLQGYKDGCAAASPRVGPAYPEKLPCAVKCEADEGDGGIRFGKGVNTDTMLAYLARRVEYNKEPPPTEEQKAAFRALRGDATARDCICADPENCTQAIPGYRCRKNDASNGRGIDPLARKEAGIVTRVIGVDEGKPGGDKTVKVSGHRDAQGVMHITDVEEVEPVVPMQGDDIVKVIREAFVDVPGSSIAQRAADEIERLRKRVYILGAMNVKAQQDLAKNPGPGLNAVQLVPVVGESDGFGVHGATAPSGRTSADGAGPGAGTTDEAPKMPVLVDGVHLRERAERMRRHILTKVVGRLCEPGTGRFAGWGCSLCGGEGKGPADGTRDLEAITHEPDCMCAPLESPAPKERSGSTTVCTAPLPEGLISDVGAASEEQKNG